MPWIRSKTRDENIAHIEGTEEEIEEQFEAFLERQRQMGHTVAESEDLPGEWHVNAANGDFIDIYYLD